MGGVGPIMEARPEVDQSSFAFRRSALGYELSACSSLSLAVLGSPACG